MSERSDAIYKLAAHLKRARKAAKREEDARRTWAGKGWRAPRPWWDRPHGLWDATERHYAEHGGWVSTPRWRQRLNHRRSLPWVGRTWFDSEAQFFRTRTPRRMLREVKR